LNELTDQINQITSQLECFDIKKVAGDIRLKLNEWRFDSYKVIDKFYEKKYTELNYYISEIVNKQEKEINDLRLKLAKIINIQQTTHNNMKLVIKDIKTLQQQMNKIEHISSQVNIRPLVIVDRLIDIDKSNLYQSHLSRLSSPYRIIERTPLSSNAMASNNQYLLLHQNSNLYLMDGNLSVIRQNTWLNDWIQDMCWSHVLNCFFIITLDKVYQIDVDTLSIKYLNTIEGRFWQSCTCSDTSLYLSKDLWNSSIDEFNLKSSIRFVKNHKTARTIDHKQRIDSIEYSDGNLALAINDQSKKEIFIELRSITNFDRLWLCRLSTEYSERKIQCALGNYHTWLVSDWGSSSLISITKDGKVEKTIEYEYEVRYVNIFSTNTLVISTGHSINFHKL